jgi:hypothetical protein
LLMYHAMIEVRAFNKTHSRSRMARSSAEA